MYKVKHKISFITVTIQCTLLLLPLILYCHGTKFTGACDINKHFERSIYIHAFFILNLHFKCIFSSRIYFYVTVYWKKIYTDKNILLTCLLNKNLKLCIFFLQYDGEENRSLMEAKFLIEMFVQINILWKYLLCYLVFY